MRSGETVSAFERALASYCGAKYCVSAANGTVTLQAALAALRIKPGDRVGTTPLTMSATTIAILNVGAVPVYCDVDPQTWLMDIAPGLPECRAFVGVSLYGLHLPNNAPMLVDDAAQTLRRHGGGAFTSLSFQSSKIISTGEGGALLTDHEELAERARSYLSLGYQMSATQARIDSSTLKAPTFERHHTWPAINGRMADVVASRGLRELAMADSLKKDRLRCALLYHDVIRDVPWITVQHAPVPPGQHDYWAYAIACDTPARALALSDAVVKFGGERPYAAWQLAYREPFLRDFRFYHRVHGGELAPEFQLDPKPSCPVAESLQPRLLQFQTNSLGAAQRNAQALTKAIAAIG